MSELFAVAAEVADALATNRPVVALESTLISHGLPAPANLECARSAEAQIRAEGAIPATIAVIHGRVRVGLDETDLNQLAHGDNIAKLSRNDLASACANGISGATTVAATMICARRAGIDVFATGGLGGVHRGWQQTLDISADLYELARTPVTVVCSGAKSLLDLPATTEVLESLGVPLIGLGTTELPAFYSQDSGLALQQSVDHVEEAVQIIRIRRGLEMGGGEVLAVPPPEGAALATEKIERWTARALQDAAKANITGKALTPFLLGRIAELSEGLTLKANVALIQHNARIAARLASALSA